MNRNLQPYKVRTTSRGSSCDDSCGCLGKPASSWPQRHSPENLHTPSAKFSHERQTLPKPRGSHDATLLLALDRKHSFSPRSQPSCVLASGGDFCKELSLPRDSKICVEQCSALVPGVRIIAYWHSRRRIGAICRSDENVRQLRTAESN